MKNIYKNFSSRPVDLFCRLCWNDSACSLFPATTTQLFSESLSSHTFCSNLKVLFATNKLCKFRRSKLQQVNPTAFAAGTVNLSTNGVAVLPIPCVNAPNPRPRCRPIPLHSGIFSCLEATTL